MQFHNLKRKTKNKKSKTVGRGGTRGKTSGRGGKGQTARAGHNTRPEIRDFIKRIPKLRGRGIAGLRTIQEKFEVVSLSAIEKTFGAGEEVSPKTLVEKGLISMKKGSFPKMKILSGGEISKKVIVSGCALSTKAREKIEKAGGMIQ